MNNNLMSNDCFSDLNQMNSACSENDLSEPNAFDILNDTEEDEKDRAMSVFSKNLFEVAIYIAVSVLIILLVKNFVLQYVRVDGDSMKPTLLTDEHLIVEKLSYQFGEIERFDIVVFQPYDNNDDVYYVKRVIGLPGERVFIDSGHVFINGNILDEDYGGDCITERNEMLEEITLGDDEYFVLGDNRTVSKDSRSSSVGAVKRSSIMGKACFIVYPLSRFGKIEK